MGNEEYLNEERFRKLVLKLEPECVSKFVDDFLIESAQQFAEDNQFEIILNDEKLKPLMQYGYDIEKLMVSLKIRGFDVHYYNLHGTYRVIFKF